MSLKTTSLRSSHVGCPGFDTEEAWGLFIKYYRKDLLKIGRKYVYYREDEDVLEDAFQDMCMAIRDDPYLTAPTPTRHFRPVLVRKFHDCVVRRLRMFKREYFREYCDAEAKRLRDAVSEDRFLKHRRMAVIEMIDQTFMRPDYRKCPLFHDFDAGERRIWLMSKRDGHTFEQIAQKTGIPQTTVYRMFAATRQRLTKTYETYLTRLALI